MTSVTPGRFSNAPRSTDPRFPVMPIAVRWAPGMGCAWRPRLSTAETTRRMSSGEADASITISMRVLSSEPTQIVSNHRPKGPRRSRIVRKSLFLIVAALLVLCPAAFGYVIKLKDGSLIYARMKYNVKGERAIITLENGTVTAMKLDQIDVEATDKYNTENFGSNVVAIDTPDGRKPTAGPEAPPTARLQDYIKDRNPRMQLPANGASQKTEAGTGPAFGQVDPNLQGAVSKVFDGAGITQYKLTNFKGKTGLLVTTNTEEAVFNALNAAARALSDPSARGVSLTLHLVLTTSSGESAGTLEMSPEQARLLVNGQTSAADFFVQNVTL